MKSHHTQLLEYIYSIITAQIKPASIFVSVLFLIIFLRLIIPERSFDSVGLRAIFDSLFILCLLSIILLVALNIGNNILQRLAINELSYIEKSIFATTLGFGILAYGILVLTTIQQLTPRTVALGVIILSVWFWRGIVGVVDYGIRITVTVWGRYKKFTFLKSMLASLGILLLLMTILQTLTPIWDADGLIYHLPIPKMWLNMGGLRANTDFWEANYPMTVELLFAIGLAFGSDSFAKIIHLTFALILVAATYSFARRFSYIKYAWIAPLILIGIPIIPLWASSSYSDMGWAVFEFLSLYSLVLWLYSARKVYLIIGGLMIGWGMGSKYPALGTFAILGLWLVWQSRKSGCKQIIVNCIAFGAPALAIGIPWYAKNWIWFHNPIYPLSIGSLVSSSNSNSLWMTYMRDGFGTGKSMWDYILTPINLFAQRERYGTFAGNIEIPSPLFLLAIFYPFSRRSSAMNSVAMFVFFRYFAWLFGVQQTRLLLPIFPALSLLAGEVLATIAMSRLPKPIGRGLVVGLVGGMFITTLIYTFLLYLKTRPLDVILGQESKGAFLSRLVDNYPATQFILTSLPPQSRVMMMWDGRGYYCDSRCMPDSDHTQWTELILSKPELTDVTSSLQAMGVTHLFFSISDSDFILQHDPTRHQFEAMEYFLTVYRPACTQVIFQDAWVSLYEVTCSIK